MNTPLDSSSMPSAACGKVILLGEHAVVHGERALAVSVGQAADALAAWSPEPSLLISDNAGPWSLPLDPDLQTAFSALLSSLQLSRPASVQVRVRIPTRAGLGSSAAIGVAIARSLARLDGREADDDRDSRAATAWERVFHGNPSGIDVAAAVLGGVLSFSRTQGVARLSVARPPTLCLVQSGPRASTRFMVEAATAFLQRQPDRGQAILSAIRSAVQSGIDAIEAGDFARLGDAMNANQLTLRQWQLSTDSIDRLCESALEAGALGAKLTGAGGGGSVVALAPGREQDILEAWRRLGFDGIVVRTGTLNAQ